MDGVRADALASVSSFGGHSKDVWVFGCEAEITGRLCLRFFWSSVRMLVVVAYQSKSSRAHAAQTVCCMPGMASPAWHPRNGYKYSSSSRRTRQFAHTLATHPPFSVANSATVRADVDHRARTLPTRHVVAPSCIQLRILEAGAVCVCV